MNGRGARVIGKKKPQELGGWVYYLNLFGETYAHWGDPMFREENLVTHAEFEQMLATHKLPADTMERERVTLNLNREIFRIKSAKDACDQVVYHFRFN